MKMLSCEKCGTPFPWATYDVNKTLICPYCGEERTPHQRNDLCIFDTEVDDTPENFRVIIL